MLFSPESELLERLNLRQVKLLFLNIYLLIIVISTEEKKEDL